MRLSLLIPFLIVTSFCGVFESQSHIPRLQVLDLRRIRALVGMVLVGNIFSANLTLI